MSILEGAQSIDVLDILVSEGHSISPIEGANVSLDSFHQSGPLVTDIIVYLPTILLGILDSMPCTCKCVVPMVNQIILTWSQGSPLSITIDLYTHRS